MASVPIEISGVLFDKTARTQQSVVLIGEASIYGLSIGGGPIMPPDGPPPIAGWTPPGYHPSHPIAPGGPPPTIGGGPIYPPIISGPPGPWPTPPIHIPPVNPIQPLPPNLPNVPPPGSPPVHVGGTQPIQPITPPAAVVIDYPGIGKVVVPQPTDSVSIPVPPDPGVPPPDPNAPVVTPH
jgi:hypothetical protein